MESTIELCRVKGQKGFFVPINDFISLTQFIITHLQRNRQTTVFELIDEALEHFDNYNRLQLTLLTVKQHLVNKGVLAIRFIPGRNQLIELSNDFKKSRVTLRDLVDQPHLRSRLNI